MLQLQPLSASVTWCLSVLFWAFRLRRRAFRSIFATLRSAKDAAPIPNATAELKTEKKVLKGR